MTYRVTLWLSLSAAMATCLAQGDDRNRMDPSAVATPPPREFAPMTRSERFSHYLAGLADPESVLRAAASGGIRQAAGTPKEWGGGAAGYGDRVGSAFAQHVIQRTLEYGASAALHEDNRYFVSGETGFFS